tara:strand:+ start:888 stop:1040 length:153 start_codon:yes stop_codon:yes gene_type:complete
MIIIELIGNNEDEYELDFDEMVMSFNKMKTEFRIKKLKEEEEKKKYLVKK